MYMMHIQKTFNPSNVLNKNPLLLYSKLDVKALIHLRKWLITLSSERHEN